MRNFKRGGGPRRSYGGGFGRNDRHMFNVVCGNCGKDCQVPFRPTGDKPVYCSDCFGKMGNRGNRRSFDQPRFGEGKYQNDQYKPQFETLNTKLDKILNLLRPKSVPRSSTPIKIPAATPIGETETKTPKAEHRPKKQVSEEKE
ncbi:hypothetical protein M1523_03010 [Patescibacteria group bacterium]|nr:hypothetical protein [Patescibacteria group bacterium]MCL5091309.1 hypothetical protein [Patescibacteria group bacterium]